MRRQWQRTGAALLLTTQLATQTACFSWRATPLQPQAAPASGAPVEVRYVRVTLRDGRTLGLQRVTIAADSVVGWAGAGTRQERVHMRRADIERLEVHDFHPWRTAVLVAVTAYVVGFVTAYSGEDT
jgi:hypothetical protein